jgi:erythromycin esterase-like protein
MVETLAAVVDHLSLDGQRAKITVWAQNLRLGDVRTPERHHRGQLNVGLL